VGAIIVLADDEPDLRSIYAVFLRKEGFVVHEAGDGREAIGLVESRRPHLLILDVWMPILNGLEVVEHLRHDRYSGGLKIVMLSNLNDSDTRLEGFSAGVCDYWVKGMALDDLCRRVKRILAEPHPADDLAGSPANRSDFD
jgi:DNA-binding response OmpR family regulator